VYIYVSLFFFAIPCELAASLSRCRSNRCVKPAFPYCRQIGYDTVGSWGRKKPLENPDSDTFEKRLLGRVCLPILAAKLLILIRVTP
jgi:hypothetical protein